MKKRVPFLVLALMASAAAGQAVTPKTRTEKAKTSATTSEKRKAGKKSSGTKKVDTSKSSDAGERAGQNGTSGKASKPEQPLVAGVEAEVVGDVLPDVPKHRSDLAALAKASAREVSKMKAMKPGEDKLPIDDAGEEPAKGWRGTGPTVTLATADLEDFDGQPIQVQRLIQSALDLTKRNLRYDFGSADPSTGGLDCSGMIQYLLKRAGISEPPRDSTGFFLWAEKAGTLQKVRPEKLDDPVLAELRPGDLMFWEGTYDVKRDPPISHIMIYLGREKQTGLPVMVGSSDGRTYAGIRRSGVSVFDFKLPKTGSKAKFVGFARVPGLEAVTASR